MRRKNWIVWLAVIVAIALAVAFSGPLEKWLLLGRCL